MRFQLDLRYDSTEKISYQQHIFLAGSCFAESIGERFSAARFHTVINPSGILYNPHSIAFSLRNILEEKQYAEHELLSYNDLWHSLHHHGCFSSKNKSQTLGEINALISSAHDALKKTGWLIITFGSAFAWKYKASGDIVANCHKLPGTEFEKMFLSADLIVEEWTSLLTLIRKFNPQLKIMFTVSPVRYIRDGLMENSLSKASLITAIHELCGRHNTLYFPAYEYVTDVLRDYRFYKEDMVHPTKQAVDFVWEKFTEQVFDRETKQILAEVEKFNSLSSHIPLHDAEIHEKKVEEQRKLLHQRYPFLKWH